MGRLEAAAALRQRGHAHDALDLIHRELADDPQSLPALLELGWTFLALGDPAQALEVGQQALKLFPDDAFAHYLQANALGSMGSLAGAEAAVDRALARRPGVDCFHSYKAEICRIQSRFDDALTHSAAALAADPIDEYALLVRVRSLRGAWRNDEALELARSALSHHPEHPALLLEYGELCVNGTEHEEGSAALRAALHLAPGSDRARAGVLESLFARSTVYRHVARFLRLSERVKASFTTPRMRRGMLLYFVLTVAVYALTHSDAVAGVMMLPLSLGLLLFAIWGLVYVSVYLLLPLFYARTLFDRLGRMLMFDRFVAWSASVRNFATFIAIGVSLGLSMLWPPIALPVLVLAPLAAHRRLSSRAWRRVGTVVTAVALASLAAAALRIWLARFDGLAGRFALGYAGACLALVALTWLERRWRTSAGRRLRPGTGFHGQNRG